jgi:hypothetical protein
MQTMRHARSILLVADLLLIGLPPARAAETPPPAPTNVGMSQKVCQLTGDVDWETGQPTAARARTNFGLDAVDLGYQRLGRERCSELYSPAGDPDGRLRIQHRVSGGA